MPEAPDDIKIAALKAAWNCFGDCTAWGGDEEDALASAITEYIDQLKAAGYVIVPAIPLEAGKENRPMDEPIKPCPHCGGSDIRFDAHWTGDYRSPDKRVWSMGCYDCGATFPNRFKRELLVEEWNRRVPLPTLVEAEGKG